MNADGLVKLLFRQAGFYRDRVITSYSIHYTKLYDRIWNIVGIMSPNPEVLRASMQLYRALLYGASPLTRRQREMLAVGQVGLAMLLTVGATLLLRSFVATA